MSKMDYKDWSKNDLIREIAGLKDALRKAFDVETEGVLMVEGICRIDGTPFVQFRDGAYGVQMSPAAARTHALFTLNAAVEAERDAAVVAFCISQGMDKGETSGFLSMMRGHRKDWLEEFQKIIKEDTRSGN